MAIASANQLTIQITSSMRLGAMTRALTVSTYIAQLADADCAEIRALKITPPLSAAVKAGSRESDNERGEQSPLKMPEHKRKKILALLAEGLPPNTVASRIGVSAPTIYRTRAEAHSEAQKKAGQAPTADIGPPIGSHNNPSGPVKPSNACNTRIRPKKPKRQTDADYIIGRLKKENPALAQKVVSGEMSAHGKRLEDSVIDAYRAGTPVAALAVQFQKSVGAVYYLLKKRGVPIQHVIPVQQAQEAIAAVEGGESWRTVSARMHVSRATLQRTARKLGFRIAAKKESNET